MTNCLNLELPFGLGANYALPRAVIQGSVFSSMPFRGRAVRPAYTKPTLVAEYGHVQVFQTVGEQLDQGDADVYAELVRLAVEQYPEAKPVISLTINADAFLKSIGRTRGTENRKWLADSIARLKRASFLFDVPGLKFWETSLILEYLCIKQQKTQAEYTINLNTRMVEVYKAGWSLIKSSERKALMKNPLAKALHAFYSSSTPSFDLKTDTLKKLTGRSSMRDDRWLASLDEALGELAGVTGWKCERRGDKVSVGKPKANKPAPKRVAEPAARTPAQREPEPKRNPWDAVTSWASVRTLPLQGLVLMMDEGARKRYEAYRDSKQELSSEALKFAAIEFLEPQVEAWLSSAEMNSQAYTFDPDEEI